MKLVIQRVVQASVSVEGIIISAIGNGMVILPGIGKEDDERSIVYMAEKVVKLRIFSDSEGKMNKSIIDTDGEVLVVSQFTLLADITGGNRPSFIHAAEPEKAKHLYELFIGELRRSGIRKVASGKFGAYMNVDLVNDGPVTMVL